MTDGCTTRKVTLWPLRRRARVHRHAAHGVSAKAVAVTFTIITCTAVTAAVVVPYMSSNFQEIAEGSVSEPVSVPEPGSLAVFGAALGVFMGIRRVARKGV